MLLLTIEPKNNMFSDNRELDMNAIKFDDFYLNYFNEGIEDLLNSVSAEWVKVNDDIIHDDINRINFNFYFKRIA
jgi:hypothetical protein|nr:MAG TPA_asm: hypothetical protein [Caudoviricetes sp.]